MKSNEEGQSLVEAIIAMTAAILVVSSIVGAVIVSLNNAQYSKYQNLATQYAQEGIEVVKKISVANWTNFSALTNLNYCLPEGGQAPVIRINPTCDANVYSVGNPATQIFRRSIDIEQSSVDCSLGSKVTSTVSWSDSKCTSGDIYCHSVVLRTCISRSQNISAP